MREFLKVGADVNAVDEEGFTTLAYAASTNQAAVVDLLLSKGARADVGPTGNAPLVVATVTGSYAVMEKLLRKRPDPVRYNAALKAGAMRADPLAVQLLVKRAELNAGQAIAYRQVVSETYGRELVLKGVLDLDDVLGAVALCEGQGIHKEHYCLSAGALARLGGAVPSDSTAMTPRQNPSKTQTCTVMDGERFCQ